MGKIRSERKHINRYTPILPIKESFPSSTSELLVLRSNYVNPTSLQSHSQLATPHKEWYYPCNPECIVCITPSPLHFLQGLTRPSQLIASSALMSDLTSLFRKNEYNAIIQAINSLNIKNFDRETSVYLHFAIGRAYYELKHLTHARNHLCECKLIASGAGDISVCYFYLGKVASALHSPRKAAKHYRKAALCCQESSLAKMFNLIQPSRSALHHESAHEFRLVNCFPQALEELTQAIETAQTKEECFSAHYDRGKLYQVMAKHTKALDDFELAGELAEECDSCVAAKRAYKAACCACIMLNHTKEALCFFKCSLTCVSVECRRCFAGSEQRICDLHWICDIIDHLPIYTAIMLIPRTYINGLMHIRQRISSQFQAVLERYPIDCQEEEGARPNVYPIVTEEHFPLTEPPNPHQVISFVELAERPPEDLCQVEIPITGLPIHRSNHTLLLNQIQQFPWQDPDFRNERSLIEIQSVTILVS